jgi:ankyrin repeat protein
LQNKQACSALCNQHERVANLFNVYSVILMTRFVLYMSSNRVDVTIPDKNGAVALHKAARAGHLQMVTELIAAGSPVLPTDSQGNSPLHEAAAGGHVKVLRYLLTALVRGRAGMAHQQPTAVPLKHRLRLCTRDSIITDTASCSTTLCLPARNFVAVCMQIVIHGLM